MTHSHRLRFASLLAVGTLLLAGCPDSTIGPAADASDPADSAPPIDAASPIDAAPPGDATVGDGGCNVATSPSGYACDPWSVHTYMNTGAVRMGDTLRLQLRHDPDEYEGAASDVGVPPAHQYFQTLVVDVALTPAIREHLCVVFTPGASAPVDAHGATFLADVDDHRELSLLDRYPDDSAAHVDNLVDVCGTSLLGAVAAPQIATGRPVLPDVAIEIPLAPRADQFTPGTVFTGWLARGYWLADEQSELAPPVTATVVSVTQ